MERAVTKRSPPSLPSSAAVKPRAAVFERRTRRRLSETAAVYVSGEGEGEEEEEEEVEEKIELLKKMVPGATALGVDALFEETATYIVALQCQIKAMRLLSSFLQRFHKDILM